MKLWKLAHLNQGRGRDLLSSIVLVLVPVAVLVPVPLSVNTPLYTVRRICFPLATFNHIKTITHLPAVDLGLGGCAPGQNFFIFMQFLVKSGPIVGWRPSYGLALPSGKSLILHYFRNVAKE